MDKVKPKHKRGDKFEVIKRVHWLGEKVHFILTINGECTDMKGNWQGLYWVSCSPSFTQTPKPFSEREVDKWKKINNQ